MRAVYSCSLVQAITESSLSHHDLAHFVVEKQLGLTGGFLAMWRGAIRWSNSRTKKSFNHWELSPGLLKSSRALGSLSAGACTPEQFSELVNTELALMSIPEVADLTANVATDMLSRFNELHAQYLALEEGVTLELEF